MEIIKIHIFPNSYTGHETEAVDNGLHTTGTANALSP